MLALAWKIDGMCHQIIERLDPMSYEEGKKVIEAFKEVYSAKRKAEEKIM